MKITGTQEGEIDRLVDLILSGKPEDVWSAAINQLITGEPWSMAGVDTRDVLRVLEDGLERRLSGVDQALGVWMAFGTPAVAFTLFARVEQGYLMQLLEKAPKWAICRWRWAQAVHAALAMFNPEVRLAVKAGLKHVEQV